MGSLILCHKKRARQPYVISRVHMKIYTIEELCYYICNNLYLIDYTIINQQLCDWIGRELDMEELSEHLREELRKNCLHGAVYPDNFKRVYDLCPVRYQPDPEYPGASPEPEGCGAQEAQSGQSDAEQGI